MEDSLLAVFIDFENLAMWAEREFFDFEITPLIEYLQTRGPAVVKRAYGDWSRFSRYRDELMNNSIDLIQIYSIRGSKNRADIRMVVDALELSMTRPHINTYVIVSGDSDFGPLVVKLREYGKYILGIGPRSVTHHLLVKSCDEFVYLETALGVMMEIDESCLEIESARNLITKALHAHGSRGELPVLATRLKQTMLLLDPAFNEANFGYSQFKSWLEDNRDLIRLFVKDMQLYVTSPEFGERIEDNFLGNERQTFASDLSIYSRPALETQYKQVFFRTKFANIDTTTRRDILRDIYREINENPNAYTADELIDLLDSRYVAQGLVREKSTIFDVFQMVHRQRIIDADTQPITMSTPIRIHEEIESEADFVCGAESESVYQIIRGGIEVDTSELAFAFFNDRNQQEYINCMLDSLESRNWIVRVGNKFQLPGKVGSLLEDEKNLQVLLRDLDQIQIPNNQERGKEAASVLARKAMVQRSQDFIASGNNYLLACKLQWEAVEQGEEGATLDDLRWYMASYASVIAGKLSQVNRDYSGARPYYLSFFALVQEQDPLWSRMRGLINPMLSYYWANAGRELDLNISAWNLSMSSPAQIAVIAANHQNPELRKLWEIITIELARVNPGILRRIANQLFMSRAEGNENTRTGQLIEEILSDHAQPV